MEIEINTADDQISEDDNLDERDWDLPSYSPRRALSECCDLWGSGAWPESNAGANLDEVMEHVLRLLDLA